MDWTQLFICITGLAGHLLIARQDRRGYWFWIAGNFAIIKLSLSDGHYGMAGLFLVYTFISLKALLDWGRKDKLSQATARTQSVRAKCPRVEVNTHKRNAGSQNGFIVGIACCCTY